MQQFIAHSATQELRLELDQFKANHRRLLTQLYPLVADASWKQNASKIMHELTSVVIGPTTFLDSAYSNLLNEIDRLETIDCTNDEELCEIRTNLKAVSYAISKANLKQSHAAGKIYWYFYLTAQQNQEENLEKVSIAETISQACSPLKQDNQQVDYELESPDSDPWKVELELPETFAFHTFEALFRNAFDHSDASTPIRFQIRWEEPWKELVLSWENSARPSSLPPLADNLKKPESERPFGLRLAYDIARNFLKSELLIHVDSEAKKVHHHLVLKNNTGTKSPFYSLTG